ncbi:hypothetical protein E2C01_057537 [Portunus trituberculatus]|uniref:Uncharacterized protein n=1 Tax=Portunus trituberculatus TaxID=210409 RepID=A0A5B7H0L4_PORTR|nr:hypothetical protein [Portunus trituberculatus]
MRRYEYAEPGRASRHPASVTPTYDTLVKVGDIVRSEGYSVVVHLPIPFVFGDEQIIKSSILQVIL